MDDDFIDVAATVAGGNDNGALRALSGTLDGTEALRRSSPSPTPSASTSSQHHHQSLPSAATAAPHVRRGWFSSLFRGGGTLPAVVQAARSKTFIDHPDLSVTCASNFPDRLRLIKTVHLFPLQLKLKADYVRSLRDVQVGCSVKDSILGGSLRVDAASRTLCYHKRLPLSFGGGGGGGGSSFGGAHVGIFAGMSYDGLLPLGSRGDANAALSLGGGPARPRPPPLSMESLRPSLTFRYELGGGGAVWTGDAFALRHRFRVSKGLGLEVRGSARLPAPRAELRVGGGGGGAGGTNRDDGSSSRISLGEGGAHLHVEEVNLVFHL